MKNYEFCRIQLETGKMISCQIADQMLPIFFEKKDNLAHRILDIQFYILWHQMIMDLGEKEHTGDWDPAATIKLYDGTEIGNEEGFWVMEIQGDKILLEAPNQDGESEKDCYHIIPIMEIESISYRY